MDTRTRPEVTALDGAVQPAIGEIVEASTTHVRAVAAVVFDPPAFGGFVRCASEGRKAYGIVSHVQHATIDPSRRAIPLGRSWDEIAREQPQVLELLSTEFDAQIVAFADPGGPFHPYLPPSPPRVHDFVFACSEAEVAELTEDLTFVRTLASLGHQLTDELIAASIRAAAEVREDRRRFLLVAGREVADLYRQDYERARSILRRVGMRVAGDGWARTPPASVAVRQPSDR